MRTQAACSLLYTGGPCMPRRAVRTAPQPARRSAPPPHHTPEAAHTCDLSPTPPHPNASHPHPSTRAYRQAVLSVTQDDFFRAHKDDNYGDLDAAVRTMLDDYAASRGAKRKEGRWSEARCLP